MLQLRRQLLQLLTVAAGAALLSFSLLLGPSAEVLAVAAEAVLVSAKAEMLANGRGNRGVASTTPEFGAGLAGQRRKSSRTVYHESTSSRPYISMCL